ncbi:MAG: helix-turn-helix domain-containing protein [Bacteroidales bacterium]|nr:helix-turn-helix domain-containing protein [Bacteroidales bacterium]
MESNLQNFNIPRLKSVFFGDHDMNLGNDILIADVRYDETLNFFRYPCRFDGYMVVFCIGGSLTLDVNLHSYKIGENSIVISLPSHIIRVADVDEQHKESLRCMVIAMSKEFISGIHLDFASIFNESRRLMDNPVLSLEGEELDVAKDYLKLAVKILSSDILSSKKEVLSSLLSSFCYAVGDSWIKKINKVKSDYRPSQQSQRLNSVFEEFIHLVTEYHESQRNVAFYAERLCLTPKYLSKLIKQVSGRSAPEWIDSFVILEAKNLLKYSDSTIKEVVYRLHFPNQSVFYKYFKAHTGMTPSEYRRS